MATAFVALCALPSAAAKDIPSPKTFVIQGDSRLGSFSTTGPARFAAAIAAFGEPSAVSREGDRAFCTARWASIGLSMTLYVIDQRQNPCLPEYGCFWSALMTSKAWRTAKGLRIGDPRRHLYALYPKATPHGAWRWLLTRPGSNEAPSPVLETKLTAQHVIAFRVNGGSCGI